MIHPFIKWAGLLSTVGMALITTMPLVVFFFPIVSLTLCVLALWKIKHPSRFGKIEYKGKKWAYIILVLNIIELAIFVTFISFFLEFIRFV